MATIPPQTNEGREGPNILVLGIGSFAHATTGILREEGGRVRTYLTRDYGRFPPSLTSTTFTPDQVPNPATIVRDQGIDLIIPMSIDWARAPWAQDLIDTGVPIFCPQGDALRIERERDFARELCQRYGAPYPRSYVAHNRLDAEAILDRDARPFVIKNPLCAPGSPIHTIVCDSVESTRNWLGRIDYSEGAFLQEYLGQAEAGHLALIRDGDIVSLATNQEYKKAFTGNMGVTAGAPLGGILHADPEDRYGIAKQTLWPLRDWFREIGYRGPIQVTAIWRDDQWQVIEYNSRTGVTASAMLFRQLRRPASDIAAFLRGEDVSFERRPDREFGVSLTLAGYGYPYVQLEGPDLPVFVEDGPEADIWWNEARKDEEGRMWATGHRIADVVAMDEKLDAARRSAYATIGRLRSPGAYYRTDIAQTLWPPGTV